MPSYSMLYRCYVRRLSSATQEGSGASSLNITEVKGVKVVVAMDHTHLRYACSSCDVVMVDFKDARSWCGLWPRSVRIWVCSDACSLQLLKLGRTQYSANMLCMPLALCKAPIADCRELA